MPTLYQKYRPQQFADLAGQEHIIQTITNEIKNDKIAHAYLFYGARGIGKTTIARLLSKAMNCETRKTSETEPCNKCNSCQEISSGNSIDIIEIDAASHTGVDNVRENIIENAQFRPTKSKYKVFIIDEVHMLSNSAFNALLKTLEEPPPHAIFILATTELHKLPATIISRCERFHFQKIAYKEMLKTLQDICKAEKIKVEKLVLEKIINKSDGALRDAQSLLGQILSLNKTTIKNEDVEIILPSSNVQTTSKIIKNILEHKTQDNLKLLQEKVDDGVNLDQLAYDLLELFRLMILIKNNADKEQSTDYSPDDYRQIEKMTNQVELGELILLTEKLINRKSQIKSSPIPQLPLELYIIEAGTLNSDDNNNKNDDIIESQNKQKKPDNKAMKKNNKEESPTYREKIKTKISNLKTKKINTTFEEIQDKWDDIKSKITEKNHALSFVLNMCSLKILDKNIVIVMVPYELHRDKLEEPQNKHIIDEVLAEEFKEPISFCCEIQAREEKNTDDINSLAAEFGGEVV